VGEAPTLGPAKFALSEKEGKTDEKRWKTGARAPKIGERGFWGGGVTPCGTLKILWSALLESAKTPAKRLG